MWLELYIIGCIVTFGITFSDKASKDDPIQLKVFYALFSWFSVGLKLGELKKE